MAKLSPSLAVEMKSECGHAIEDIVNRKSPAEFDQIRSILADGEKADPVELHNAINILGRWGDRAAVSDVISLMPKLDERGLINAVDSLGRLGGMEALQAILWQADVGTPDVRRFVVLALNEIGSKKAMDKISAMAKSDDSGFVRAKARELINRKNDQQ